MDLMNPIKLRMKNSKKAVTPVIATIILIAATIVLALVVGAYTFGLFGSNVKTVTIPSANLASGTEGGGATGAAYLSLSINNPGASTTISSLTMTSNGLTTPATTWCVHSTPCSVSNVTLAVVNPGTITPMTLYPLGTLSITSGQTFSVVINFANGQSISQPLVAS